MSRRSTFLPLITYPEPVSDDAVDSALRFVKAMRGTVRMTTYAVDIPQIGTPLGGFLLDLPALARSAEDRSAADANRLTALVSARCGAELPHAVSTDRVNVSAVHDAALETARLSDVVVVPWSQDAVANRDLAEALVFGAGRPVVIVPSMFKADAIDHIAIAWDGSRVAARALGDALPLLAAGGHVTVLTVSDEKPLNGRDPAGTLVADLTARGVRATARTVSLGDRKIATALQEAAVEAGAQMMAMGGFGHSRLRDFVLGGATTGVLSDLRVATLLSH